MEKSKILIITGMHRSGTSVVTQWLRQCGLETGNEQRETVAPGHYRHFEDADFMDAHKAILKSHRMPESGFTTAPLQALSYHEKDRLKDIIFYKNRFNRQWGWKDPRTCLFLDTYRELAPDAFYFVIWRGYQSVTCSLLNQLYKESEKKYMSRTGIGPLIWNVFLKKNYMKKLCRKYCVSYLKVWIAYYGSILEHIKHLPDHNYIITEHTALHENDQPVFKRLTGAWGFELRFKQFKPLFKEALLNTSFNIDAYIKDAALIVQAKHIENELLRLAVINSRHYAPVAV